MPGTVHPKRTYLHRVVAGTAEADGKAYDMTTNFGNGTPIVESKQTGKFFTLSWPDILDMAVQAGIDEKDATEDREDTEDGGKR